MSLRTLIQLLKGVKVKELLNVTIDLYELGCDEYPYEPNICEFDLPKRYELEGTRICNIKGERSFEIKIKGKSPNGSWKSLLVNTIW